MSAMRRGLKKLGKSCAITALGFLLSWIMVYDFTSLSYFAPLEKASDFLASDFYELVAQSRTVKGFDDRIAVVSVDRLNRRDISETLRALAAGKAKVVAVDIMFEERGDESDTDLADALSQIPLLIFPEAITYDDADIASGGPSIYSYLDNGTPGVVNLDVNTHRNVVRTFKPVFVENGREEESIAYAGVKSYLGREPKGVVKNGDSMDVDYTSVEFDCFDAQEVIENPELVKDKLVFVGELENLSDVHSTPLDEYVPGVMIHAYSASTLLNGNYIYKVPKWGVWVISILLSIFFIYVQLSVGDSQAGNMLMRWLQAGILLMLVFVGSLLYIEKRVSLDLSLPLFMIALGLLACDLWQMMETIPAWPRWIAEKWGKLREAITKLSCDKKYFKRLKKVCSKRKK